MSYTLWFLGSNTSMYTDKCCNSRKYVSKECAKMRLAITAGPLLLFYYYTLWQYGLLSFQMGGTKLERFFLRINILNGNYWILRIGLVGASEVRKVNNFHLLSKKNNSNWNNGLILMLLLFFINKIKNLCQFFNKKHLNERTLNHIVIIFHM